MTPDDPAPDFSDVQSGSSSTAPGAPAPAASGAQSYTVASGDNLRKISRKFYGDEMKWKKIWEANKAAIPNPDVIRVGQVLQIPSA